MTKHSDNWIVNALARFADSLEREARTTSRPFDCNKWIASSVLQKSVRRGEVELAKRAILTYFKLDPKAVWRRLLSVAFEDVGAAAIDVLIETAAVCSSTAWRSEREAEHVLQVLARKLAQAPKDRGADFLMWIAMDHRAYGETRAHCSALTIEGRLSVLKDVALPIEFRAVAAWYCSGLDFPFLRRAGRGDLTLLAETYVELGASVEFSQAMVTAARMTREPYTALVPLVWLEIKRSGASEVVNEPMQSLETIDGIPLCAFDEHTRIGKRAINQLVRENLPIQSCLQKYVRKCRWNTAAQHAAFYADGAPISRRLDWHHSRAIERMGIETELANAEVMAEGIEPLRTAIASALDHLNEIRRQLWSEARETGDA